MEQKKCKNKKCQKLLPKDYNHNYCENCRNKQAKQVKEIGKVVLSSAGLVGSFVITALTNGKINLHKK